MKVKVLSGKVSVIEESKQITTLSFGIVKQNSEVKVKIKIEDVTGSKLSSTCRCSTVCLSEPDTFEIKYEDSNLAAPFSKTMVLNFTENGIPKTHYIKITGNVIK